MRSTIYALSTPPGLAAVAIIRVSGPAAATALRQLAGGLPAPRSAAFRRIADPTTEEVIDRGLVLWFPGPHSATGEDLAEFQVHGGRAVVAEVLAALGRVDGLRPADRGEFTRRAVLAGKLDLTAAEGIADLIAAETAEQRRQALQQSDGALASLYDGWRTRLLSCVAHAEADLDFADEDLPGGLTDSVREIAEGLAEEIAVHLGDGHRGERLRDGVGVAILGAPNVGKSSLLNRLAGRDVAIVSSTAGTTRDVLEVHLDLDGYPAVVWDTAGLREAADEIEAEGIRRARARADAAEIRVVVVDAATPGGSADAELVPVDRADQETIIVANKSDLPGDGLYDYSAIRISAKTGLGFDAFLTALGAAAARKCGGGDGPALTRARHRTALEQALAAIRSATGGDVAELVAEDLRTALSCLGRITGRVDVEEVLDVVFRDFCIGK